MSNIKQLFREAIKHVTDKSPGPQPSRRRRSEGDAAGGFRLFAKSIFRRDTERTDLPTRHFFVSFDHAASHHPREKEPVSGFADNPSEACSVGELIAWYLANGYSMKFIRLMFPDFFSDPAPEPLWGTFDSLNPYGNAGQAFDDFPYHEQNHLAL